MSVDNNRRRFLKIILIGSGTLVVGKVLGPFLPRFFNVSSTEASSPLTKTDSSAFRVVENKKVLSIYDNSGEEIFQIDKGA